MRLITFINCLFSLSTVIIYKRIAFYKINVGFQYFTTCSSGLLSLKIDVSHILTGDKTVKIIVEYWNQPIIQHEDYVTDYFGVVGKFHYLNTKGNYI